MATIDCSTECAGGVSLSAFPTQCNQVDFGFPKVIVLAHADFDWSVAPAGDAPSVSDFQTAISAGSDMIVLNGLANGQKLAGEKQTISDADTPDNLEEVISSREGIAGNLKRFNLTILQELENLNCHQRLKMWYITSTGYCFGGVSGYDVANYISDWMHDGFGNRSYIPVQFNWMRSESETTGALQDNDYLTLVNA